MAGSLSIPFVFAGIATCTDSISHLDTDLSTIAAYVNVREVTFGLFANRPAPGTHGAAYYATDIGGGTLYLDSGVAWFSVGSTAAVGTLAARPAAGTAGRLYFATDVGGGLFYVDTGAAWASLPAAYDKVTADTTVTNTVVETTIYTKSIFGNTLGTNGKLRLTLSGKVTDTGPTAGTYTLRLKYGATTLATAVITTSTVIACTFAGVGSNVHRRIVCELDGDGATNSQLGSVLDVGTMKFTGSTPNFALVGEPQAARGTAAEDSTAAKTLVVTLQWSVAEAGKSFTMEKAMLESVIA